MENIIHELAADITTRKNHIKRGRRREEEGNEELVTGGQEKVGRNGE
jgi:hypothetical protein